jgi:6-phosphogluconolactonase
MDDGTARRTIEVVPDAGALARRAADVFAETAAVAAAERGVFAVALSGGATPRATYELLAQEPLRSRIPWERVHLYWSDERCVPPASPQSNYRLARQTFVAQVAIPAEQVVRMRGEDDPEEAARTYELELRSIAAHSGANAVGIPVLDLVLLGIGTNGHTASLFPHTRVLHENDRMVVAANVPGVGWRITMTAPAINSARHVVFVVAGEEKAAVVARVLQGPPDFERLPAQLIAPRPGRLTWLLDEAAAARLRPDRG